MSVVASSPVRYRPFAGYEDPGLPEAFWYGNVSGKEDLSGGTLRLSLIFNTAGGPVSGSLYGVEFISVRSLQNVTVNGRIGVLNMGAPTVTGIPIVTDFSVQMRNSGTGLSVSVETTGSILPIFLGGQQDSILETRLSLLVNNLVNLVQTDFEAHGYRWGPRAINSPGGPRRPVGGVWG